MKIKDSAFSKASKRSETYHLQGIVLDFRVLIYGKTAEMVHIMYGGGHLRAFGSQLLSVSGSCLRKDAEC